MQARTSARLPRKTPRNALAGTELGVGYRSIGFGRGHWCERATERRAAAYRFGTFVHSETSARSVVDTNSIANGNVEKRAPSVGSHKDELSNIHLSGPRQTASDGPHIPRREFGDIVEVTRVRRTVSSGQTISPARVAGCPGWKGLPTACTGLRAIFAVGQQRV
ncbi:hypothetical protein OBBRIDRAFT_798029 [Obba rivulosa]|uniref:Uncharacterized protein n=1 Tax=Obba rivulosa TaxID=1052685 RepID=A0A8E2AP54_9APHY|nr:hypothetical protein OBBRIDRAFT_798029 [Obba rivulosa]